MSNSIVNLLKTIYSSNITIEDWNTLINHIASGDSTVEDLISEIQTLSANVDLKANAADVYTKLETYMKSEVYNTSEVYNKSETEDLIKKYRHTITFGSGVGNADLGTIIIISERSQSYDTASMSQLFTTMQQGYFTTPTSRNSASAGVTTFIYSTGSAAIANKYYATELYLGSSISTLTMEIKYYHDVVEQL